MNRYTPGCRCCGPTIVCQIKNCNGTNPTSGVPYSVFNHSTHALIVSGTSSGTGLVTQALSVPIGTVVDLTSGGVTVTSSALVSGTNTMPTLTLAGSLTVQVGFFGLITGSPPPGDNPDYTSGSVTATIGTWTQTLSMPAPVGGVSSVTFAPPGSVIPGTITATTTAPGTTLGTYHAANTDFMANCGPHLMGTLWQSWTNP
jgi:hypothetical protein